MKTSNNFSCLFPKDWVSWFLFGVRVRAGLGVRLEELPRWFAHPLVVVCARGVSSTLFLLLAFCKWQLGVWSFCILSIICPNCTCMQLFFSPYSFFVFCCWRRGVSRCKHCSQGSQVPGPGPSLLTDPRGDRVQPMTHLPTPHGTPFSPLLLVLIPRGCVPSSSSAWSPR